MAELLEGDMLKRMQLMDERIGLEFESRFRPCED